MPSEIKASSLSGTPNSAWEPGRPSEDLHSFAWAIQLWSFVTLLSLLLAGGISPALRGAFMGSDRWIDVVDFFGTRLSQAAAISTVVLLVHLALQSTTTARNTLIGIGAALVGCAPAMLIIFAHRTPLPHTYIWASTFFGGVLLLIGAHQSQTQLGLRALAMLGGVALLSEVLHTSPFSFSEKQITQVLGTGLQSFFTWSVLLIAFYAQLRRSFQTPWKSTSMLGAAVLLAQSVPASSSTDTSIGLLIAGRSLASVAPFTTLGTAAPFALSLALLIVICSLVSRPGSLHWLIGSMITLGVVVPTTPLVAAWLALCAFALIALGPTKAGH